jgi:hypothetical protein
MNDPRTENFLTRYGYVYQLEAAMPLADIDWKEADDNPCRMGKKLDHDRVTEYGVNMLDGVEYPPLVVLEVPGQRLRRLLTGRHRGKGAMEAGLTAHDCYVVRETDTFRIDLLVRFLNTIEGTGPNRAERLAQLVQTMHSNPDAKLEDVAKMAGVGLDAARIKLREAAIEERADALGVDGVLFRNEKIFSQRTKFALGKIPLDHAFIGCIKQIAKHEDLRGGDGQALAKVLASCTTERAAAKILADRDRELTTREETHRTKKLRSPTSKATTLLGRCRKIVEMTDAGVEKIYIEGLPADELPRAGRMLDKTIDRLIELRERLKTAEEASMSEKEWRDGERRSEPPSLGPSAAPL